MTGIELLRQEMKKRGCTTLQTQNKAVAVVLDIISGQESKYVNLKEVEDRHHSLVSSIANLKFELAGLEAERIALQTEVNAIQNRAEQEISEKKAEIETYVDSFNKALTECETQEGRDTMRLVQMFVNSVNVNTKYDNTAYIIGLSSIIANGKMDAVEELKSINKNLFSNIDPQCMYGPRSISGRKRLTY